VARAPSTVYLRHLLCAPSELAALGARWWTLAHAFSAWVDPARRRWHPSSPGVEVLLLRGDSEVVSMLVRFAAGASVPDHSHAIDEDCLVLQGEMFLGDILLRTGDYQLAPAGGTHFGETSDVGVLFFFHGALDPVLKGGASAKL
jgi:quercetin dioxygenase-like cupin family protein